MEFLPVSSLAHVHVMVSDIDAASEFYRNVMDFLEMQSHDIKGNPGLAAYYGLGQDYQDFSVRLRFMSWPGVLTLKLIELVSVGGKRPEVFDPMDGEMYKGCIAGLGALSVETTDIDAAYKRMRRHARNYGQKYRIKILSEPVFVSPIKPHEIGATENSVLHGKTRILDELESAFSERAKFQVVDPFGLRWEFNNSTA